VQFQSNIRSVITHSCVRSQHSFIRFKNSLLGYAGLKHLESAVTVFICMVGCSVMRSIDYLDDNSSMVAVVRRCFFDFQILNRHHSNNKR